MPVYMTQFSYTAEAWRSLSAQPEDRTEVIRNLVEDAGAKLICLYYSFGDYDGLLIVEAPDDKVVTSAIIAAISPGHLRGTKTTTLLTQEEMLDVLRRVGELSYRGPTGTG